MENFQKNWRDLQYPKALEKDEQVSTPFYGKFTCEPLEPGYGVTLGNALRRVLLSSIQGPAITAVVIEGISHEFSSIPGVMEDVTEIILNLKSVDLKMHTYDPQTMTLNAEGPADIKASDIEKTHIVEVVNGEQHIATLAEGAKLEMELTVKMGSGYEPVSRRETHKSIGLIHVDAFFSPVKKVNYTVTNARVGQRTDYQKLTIEIWTNGTILPEEALAYSAKIIKQQLNVFIDFDEEAVDNVEEEESRGISGTDDKLFVPIEDVELSVRSINCLKKAEIKYIGEVVQKTEQQLLDLENFGKTSLEEVRARLEEMGLSLGMTIDTEVFKKEKRKRDTESAGE
ncbi:MAG: DNA-directed RNA polymerase subunit alpha [Candidatus Dadabacteria bacterium]|nr:DNA-directed RNA polymerase subunit alpha [Candidatus Dadabacteria bacterium]MCY4261958.1 DNA-directed RNA polymerase subunit alpha [Candidatus Dadabacteria bacterium]